MTLSCNWPSGQKKKARVARASTGNSCIFFYQRVPLIFHFSPLSGISLAQKQQASLQKIILDVRKFLQRIFCRAKTNQVHNSYLSTPNTKCLAPKLVKFESHYNILVPRVYTLRCNRRYILLDLPKNAEREGRTDRCLRADVSYFLCCTRKRDVCLTPSLQCSSVPLGSQDLGNML